MHKLTVADVKAAKLLIAIDGFEGTIVVKTALSLSALLFQRPGEIRHMEWQEINWEQNRWELPGAKMKMGLDHIVPLSAQAKQLLVEIHAHTGRGRYVFPSARGASRPLSENGVRTALRRWWITSMVQWLVGRPPRTYRHITAPLLTAESCLRWDSRHWCRIMKLTLQESISLD